MTTVRMRVALATSLLLVSFPAELALAQAPPPHKPGEICFTPNFWCLASPPGPPGWACYCPTPQGLVRGTLG